MSAQPIIAIFAQSKAVCAYLSAIVERAGYQACLIDKTAGSAPLVLAFADTLQAVPRAPDQPVLLLQHGLEIPEAGASVRVLKTPLRAAEILQALHRAINRQTASPARLDIAGHVLDTRDNLWITTAQPALKLTEKEVAILCYLKESAGSSVSRQALLDAVWAYADGVETHTLETHIYRLRQKIEADPSSPQILLTAEDGYRLGD